MYVGGIMGKVWSCGIVVGVLAGSSCEGRAVCGGLGLWSLGLCEVLGERERWSGHANAVWQLKRRAWR
jgi:hypothetical protein